ncbi:major facilitator superfamily domain-containing protein [Pisolithus orientalis]|uniref:major facilitator superfamily domain-containing protein n=1 Tax=Pisolithus orientalis TaxID=936130 RepID=UPI00222537D8|nr:major facilitator superfamily domain-containing protein [Pisolithus orientalis]KAI6012499.1 major facilitator superfamily domain-containing protein [Pisolithus orientalis]
MSQDHQKCTASPTSDKHDVEKVVPSPSSDGTQERPYSIYTPAERWFIVVIASVAALFSPLAAMTYMPAIPVIAADFHKSVELINLTVTVYMVFQGISPVFWGTLADYVGRRPIFLSCMLVLAVACIGLASVPTSDYWLLLVLRCVQAAGSASTIALGAGVVGDIATRAERGGFFGLFFIGPLLGPTFGPVIGGALTPTLGWRWIFWIFVIASALCFIALSAFFPDTLRQLVGDGSVLPSRFYRPLVPLVGHGRRGMTTERPPRVPFVNPLRILTYPDVLALLLFNAVQYALFYAIIATISSIFQSTYSFLNETEIGLCFLASGFGTTIGGYVIGKILDRDCRLLKEKLALERMITTDTPGLREAVTHEENFPIEKARLKTIPIQLLICVTCCAGYGWCLHQKVNIAVPLVLQFVFCFSVTAILNTIQTLLVDLLPAHGSSVTACDNLVRCTFGAVCVSVIDLMLNDVGVGWTYTILALISLCTSPMIWLIVRLGPRSRAKRRARNS